MARGVTIDLIVDPKGAIDGIDKATGAASGATGVLSTLGAVGGAALAALATAAVGVAVGLAGATVGAAAYADEILTAATNTNLSTDELQAYKYAAEQLDVSFETFTSSQGKFVKSMAAAAGGTGAAAEAFDTLGLSVTNADGSLVDSTDLYWQAIDALGQVSNETERTALAQQIFGKGAAEMNSIIAAGSEGFAELSAQAKANGAILSGSQLEALGAFDDKMQALNSTVDAAKNALGLTLLPILDELAGSGTNALGQFTSALLDANGDLSKAGPAFEGLGETLGNALTTAIPKIIQIATSLVAGLIQGIISQGPKLIETAVPLIADFAVALLDMLPSVLEAGLKIVVSLANSVAKAVPVLIPAAIKAIVGLVNALVANLPMVLDAALQLVIGLAQGIISALPTLIQALPQIIVGIVGFLISAIPTLIEAGLNLLLSIVEALPEIITGIVEAIPLIIVGIVTALAEAAPKLVQAGVQLIPKIVGALPTIISTIISAIPQIITGIVTAFTNPSTIAQLGNAGMQLIKGLWEGIKGQGDWLWKQLKSFFGDIIKNVKKLLGIKSPSTVFAGIGDNVVLGLERGLSAPNSINGIMNDLSDQVTGGFQSSLAATARVTAESTAAPVVGNNDGVSVDPVLHGLMRRLTDAVDRIEPGWILPEQVARTSDMGTGRLASLGAV